MLNLTFLNHFAIWDIWKLHILLMLKECVHLKIKVLVVLFAVVLFFSVVTPLEYDCMSSLQDLPPAKHSVGGLRKHWLLLLAPQAWWRVWICLKCSDAFSAKDDPCQWSHEHAWCWGKRILWLLTDGDQILTIYTPSLYPLSSMIMRYTGRRHSPGRSKQPLLCLPHHPQLLLCP